MQNRINFGIDLGTTNSLIAKFINGNVEVFKSPTYHMETLPSVVAFRKDSILVGVKAREFAEKDPKNVVSTFKRKMGTSETYKIKTIDLSVSPIELSAHILKELKTFVYTGESVEAAVITIPASFDTIQSNATKEAGYKAGFKQVMLLQEPIAASLAYANKSKEEPLSNGQWLVYDLGGGTFDVALIKIERGEMRVLDHEGDNFLGGKDFDNRIVEAVVIPYLNTHCTFNNLETDLKSASGKHNNTYYRLLNSAEEAKVLLSNKSSAEIEFDITDDEDQDHSINIQITRTEFEAIIKEQIDKTSQMIKKIFTRNNLRAEDIQFILMVGGSTYIPFVRKRVEELLNVHVKCDIDPTTAIVIGAAYFAGTKSRDADGVGTSKKTAHLKIKMVYEKATRDVEEMFSAKIDGKINGLYYRITREDGGFDTGLKKISTNRIGEDLPLLTDTYNFFRLTIYDGENNVIDTDADLIGIAQGKYSIAGQPVPHDICLEIDDLENNSTKLFLVFPKNSILPLKKKTTREVTKTIIKGSSEDVIYINVLEGSHDSLPFSNQTIGVLRISGRQLKRDLIKGSDIEITLELSESRDLTITAYVTQTDQEFKELFNPTQRQVLVDKLATEIEIMNDGIDRDITEAQQREDYEVAGLLSKKKKEVTSLLEETFGLSDDDVTDAKFQIEDKKRHISQEIDNATKDKRLSILKSIYREERTRCAELVDKEGNDTEKKLLSDIVAREDTFLNSNSVSKIQGITNELNILQQQILWRTPEFLIAIYSDLLEKRQRLNDQQQAKSLFEAGKIAYDNQNWDRLRENVFRLIDLLPKTDRDEITKGYTGIG
jgi:molecular chaperone DnaK